MAITNMLPNAVLVNQLSEGTSDGKPDEDVRDNCVAASLSEAIHILTGRTVYGDTLKDAVYGQGYLGMKAPARYAASAEVAALGISMRPINGAGAGLVAALHSQLAAGHPCLVTIPSLWGTPVSGQKPGFTTHVVCMEGWGPGWLRAGNPWGGFWHDGTDAYWAARLCYGTVWAMSRKATSMWKAHGAGGAIDGAGHTVGAGLAEALIAANAPDGVRSETAFNARGDVYVNLTDGQVWTWTHAEGARSDRGGLVIEALSAQVSQLQAELAVAQKSDNDPVAKAWLAVGQQIKAALGEL